MGSVCQGYLFHVHGLILPHSLLHSVLHCLELLWCQWGLVGWRWGNGLIDRQLSLCLQLMH